MKFIFALFALCMFSLNLSANDEVSTDVRNSQQVDSAVWGQVVPETTFEAFANRDPNRGSYYDWGQGNNGWGYCYHYAVGGRPLNEGRPVLTSHCEAIKPSYVDWGTANNGYGYCYQYTPYGVGMNEGSPVSNLRCERVKPSYFAWGTANNGYTYCYQYTSYGVPMNKGQPVSNSRCQ